MQYFSGSVFDITCDLCHAQTQHALPSQCRSRRSGHRPSFQPWRSTHTVVIPHNDHALQKHPLEHGFIVKSCPPSLPPPTAMAPPTLFFSRKSGPSGTPGLSCGVPFAYRSIMLLSKRALSWAVTERKYTGEPHYYSVRLLHSFVNTWQVVILYGAYSI
jgi:hypothetical protein